MSDRVWSSNRESEILAWERVGAMESEIRRLHSLLGRATARLISCAGALRTSEARQALTEALRSNGIDSYRAMEVLQPALKGMALALEETAIRLAKEAESG